MSFRKREYTDEETLITAKNLNDIQDAIIELEGGLFAIEGKGSGEAIALTDASARGFRGLSIYGKTTQNGTPTPEAPVELVNIGNGGSITVNIAGGNKAQSMTIETTNGLPGIPVTSGGNLTDANGQQWLCNEVDFGRGVFITRVASETISKALSFTETEDYAGRFAALGAVNGNYKPGHAKSLSTFAKWRDWGLGKAGEDSFAISGRVLYYYPATPMTAAEVNALFAEMIASETPPIIMAQLATPIETPLSEEELAAYAALHTYRDSTAVSNDAGAYMELEYVMDAKKYIDSLLKASGWIANVSLPASAWKGTKSPWSQVVQIPGVTENSQVDLTPDVSQLAIFHDKDLAFVAENEDGVVTVYAVGQKPTNDYVIQATIKEVL